MHKNLNSLILLLIIILYCACNPFSNSNGNLSASINDDILKLSNTSDDTHYYIAMGQKFMARANWAIACDSSNSIKSNSSISIPIASISKDNSDSSIVVQYWEKESENIPCSSNINHILMKFK